MIEQEWFFADRDGWGVGPWDSEPDKRQWTDPTTGYACMVRRGMFGAWCGYVGVPEGHPMHGKEASDADSLLEVHGGVTLCTSCEPTETPNAICHTPEAGEPDSVWWIGFDCAHAWDMSPGMAALARDSALVGMAYALDRDRVYRDLEYVTTECERLAQQLARAGEK